MAPILGYKRTASSPTTVVYVYCFIEGYLICLLSKCIYLYLLIQTEQLPRSLSFLLLLSVNALGVIIAHSIRRDKAHRPICPIPDRQQP